ncbi:MAG: putative DNA binding domain-containing protein [Planctomycetes bacterium]|nr:putative DNA binding domain-containing protein [Planctomycetota bacterium]
MNLHELNDLALRGESELVEFKATTGQRSEAMRTVCAMLNGLGGFVVFGITPQGKVVGQTVATSTLESIHNELRQIEPPVFPEVETIPLPSGQAVIVLHVPGGGGPFTYTGRSYLRNGPTTVTMPQPLYERKLLERMHATSRWENLPATGVSIDDLDHSEIIRTVEESIRRQRLEEPATRNIEELLVGLGLFRDGALLNASAVLFGKPAMLQTRFPHCLLRTARFRGRDKTEFLDNRQDIGNTFDLFQRAQRFFRDHLPVAGRIVPGVFERIDEPLYPPDALREAIANALCHRDYGIGGGISIAIYDDRLEISSTGILPFGLTPADLFRPHPSRPWNLLIAQTFYRRGIIEAWGRGTLKMAALMEQAGLPSPEYEVVAGEVLVRFRNNAAQRPTASVMLPDRILVVLREHGSCSISEVVAHLGTGASRRTVQGALRQLAAKGSAHSSGKGRAVRWSLGPPKV